MLGTSEKPSFFPVWNIYQCFKKEATAKGFAWGMGNFGIDWWFRTGLSWPTVKFNIHVVTHYYFSVET